MYVVILVTAKNVVQAQKITSFLIEEKLIACANIVNGVQSIFPWKGKIDRAGEVLMILKSRKSLLKKNIKAIKANHSYDVPEIIALPILGGSKDYLDWIKAETQSA